MGYNWRDTLSDFASISGTLAGFCITFIGIILGWSIANTIVYSGITFGHLAVLLVGISMALFIAASQLFLTAKNYNVWDLPDEYEDFLQKGFESEQKNWGLMKEQSLDKCKKYEKFGRICYNLSLLIMFAGVGALIYPYNSILAIIVTSLCYLLEFLQIISSYKL